MGLRLDNGEGVAVNEVGMSVGYRLESDGKIHLYTICSTHTLSASYEAEQTVPWSDTTNMSCVPLYSSYNTASPTSGTVYQYDPDGTGTNSQEIFQIAPNGVRTANWTRTALPVVVTAESTTYEWVYAYAGREELRLAVIVHKQTGAETIEIKPNITEESYLYQKYLVVHYCVYFEKEGLTVPADGVLRYTNTATYGCISVSNISSYSFTGRVRIEFDTTLKAGARYGTSVSNTFGGVKAFTFSDHKLAVNKVDEEDELIEETARFLIAYTLDHDYELGTLFPLTDTDGNEVSELETQNGQASLLYRLEADEFYLKLTEVDAPDGYVGIVWTVRCFAAIDGLEKSGLYYF